MQIIGNANVSCANKQVKNSKNKYITEDFEPCYEKITNKDLRKYVLKKAQKLKIVLSNFLLLILKCNKYAF